MVHHLHSDGAAARPDPPLHFPCRVRPSRQAPAPVYPRISTRVAACALALTKSTLADFPRGVDVTPVVWFALLSFLNEILLGRQGLLVLLSEKAPVVL